MDPSSAALQVLTIDLIHDRCQRGTISRLVSGRDQWHALIVGSPWRETERPRWQEPIVTIYDFATNVASLHNCSPPSCPFAVTLVFQAFCRVSQSAHTSNTPAANPRSFFFPALKKQHNQKDVMPTNDKYDKQRKKKAINTF